MKLRRESVLLVMALMSVFPAVATARTVKIDFPEGLNYTMKGILVEKDYWFTLSPDWFFPAPGRLELRFRHSPILQADLSTLTVGMNGSPIDSIYLDAKNLRDGVMVVSIPPHLLVPNSNRLSVTAKMRSPLKDLCQDVHNPALWTVLERESRLEITYDERKLEPDLEGFPGDYVNPDLIYGDAKDRVHAVILMPADPTPGELDAFGAIAALFGQFIGVGSGEFRVMTPGQPNSADLRDRQIVAIGRASSLKGFAPLLGPAAMGAAEESDGFGHLAEYVSPFNDARRLLVVTGRDDEAMKLVSEHLKTPSSILHLKGPAVVFDKPPPYQVVPETTAEAAYLVRLVDLKMSDVFIRGKFYNSQTFSIPNPFVGKIKDGAYMRLSMSHSGLLLPESSSLLLKVNGEPVKSIRLTPDTAPRNTWDVKIPVQYLGSRYLAIEIEVFLDIGDPECYYNHPEMAWFTLHNDTFLYLPVDTAQGETLANYPYMFLAWNRFDHLAVVLSEPVANVPMSAAFNTIAFLGQSLRSPTYVDLLVTTTRLLTDEQRRTSNLLFLSPIGRILSDASWSSVLPKELTMRQGEPDRDILGRAGFLVLSKSPFNDRGRVLTVTGHADEEIGQAAPFLYATGSVEWVRGTLAAVLKDRELRVLLPPVADSAVARFDPAKVKFEDKDGKLVPVVEMPKPAPAPSRHNVAYLVFFLLTPVLILLVILRLRALSKEGSKGGAHPG